MDHIQQLQKKMDELEKMFSSQMASFESSIAEKDIPSGSSLELDFKNFKKFIWKAVECLQQQMGFVSASLEELETRSRSGMLLLHGIKETEGEDVTTIAASEFKDTLQVQNITANSFFACHRLGKKRGSKPRPILVKFGCVRTRAAVWAAKKKFKGSGKTISEFLIASRHAVFLEARRIYGVQGSWTRDGRIVVQCGNGTRHKVTTMTELLSLSVSEPAADAKVPAEVPEAASVQRAEVAKKPAQALKEPGAAGTTRRAHNLRKKSPSASGSR
ncbi:uncharacterized protein LOC134655302 [Cydia amplana]|uniref:uncharacterized protein LOC134655302 n=1 Tax=Cydia amplana TaxID=1869771 RepID=UPI002FE61860